MFSRLSTSLLCVSLACASGVVVAGCEERPQLSVEPEVTFAPDAEPDSEPDTTTVDAGDMDAGSDDDAGNVDDGGPADAGLNVPQPSDACATYLACLTAIDPTIVDDELLGAFGPGGTCWVNGPNISDFCDVQCRAELGHAQEFADLFPECFFADAIPPDMPDAGMSSDAGVSSDAGPTDAGATDAGGTDAGDTTMSDAGVAADAGNFANDAGEDAGDSGL